MTADTAVLERALTVMAVCMGLQTLMFLAAGVAVAVVSGRSTAALTEAKLKVDRQIDELRSHVARMSATVDEASLALRRGSTAVDDVVSDVRDAMGTIRNSVGTVASVVTAPRAALALGLWRGIQGWRNRRGTPRPASQVQKPVAVQKPAQVVQKPAALRT